MVLPYLVWASGIITHTAHSEALMVSGTGYDVVCLCVAVPARRRVPAIPEPVVTDHYGVAINLIFTVFT